MRTTQALTEDAITEVHPVLSTGVDEQCGACGGRLQTDQRYCVQCGERRGAAPRPFAGGPRQRAPAPPVARAARWRVSDSTSLIAGVGTLLLAMGVGVLIGRAGNNAANIKTPPYQVVTIGAPAGAATGSPQPTATTGTPTPATHATSAAAKKAASAAAAAAAKPTPKTPPPPPVRPRTGPNRPGYTNNNFTGDFFGP